jgi:hypothetical protein
MGALRAAPAGTDVPPGPPEAFYCGCCGLVLPAAPAR